LEFVAVSFRGWNNTREPGEKPSKQGKTQQQAQHTYVIGLESNLGLIGGRGALSPLSHACSTDDNFPFSLPGELHSRITREGEMPPRRSQKNPKRSRNSSKN